MKPSPRYLFNTFIAASTLLLFGCSQSPEESSSAADSTPPAASQDDLANGLADIQKKAEAEAEKLQADLNAALKTQRSELMAQFESNTSELTNQFNGLKKQYDSLKGTLPDEVKKAVMAQIPDLESSISKLKEMVAKFDPKTLAELEAFKSKYQKEYDTALQLFKEASKLLDASGVKVPKRF